MKIVNLKQLMKNQTCIVNGEEEYCDQLYEKQPKGLGKRSAVKRPASSETKILFWTPRKAVSQE